MEKKKCPFLFAVETYRLTTQKNSRTTETYCIGKECAVWSEEMEECGLISSRYKV